MDGLVTMIVDILRKKKEEQALGPQVYSGGVPKTPPGVLALPRADAPKHAGKTYDSVVDQMVGGR